LRQIERRIEKRRERERRKKIIIRGLVVEKGKRREAVEKILKEIEMEIKVKEVWRITGDKEKGREAVGKNRRGEEEKGDLGKEEEIERQKGEDSGGLDMGERRMRKWKLEIARMEERKRKRV